MSQDKIEFFLNILNWLDSCKSKEVNVLLSGMQFVTIYL